MIFGRTTEEKNATRKARTRNEYKWHPAFAWLPVVLIDGRTVWLEEVERVSYWAYFIDGATPHSSDWCYRLPPAPSEG